MSRGKEGVTGVKTVLVTCGETSGDEHAALLVREILSSGDCRVIAMGGRKLADAGAEVLFPIDQFAFMGFFEILRHLPRVISLARKLKRLLRSGEVDLFIPVDYPGMNLRMARYAKARGIPVLYYISPQVWAWGGWRTERIGRSVDLMAVILPFEEDYYRKAGIPVYYAGHPMLDSIPAPPGPKRLPEPGRQISILLLPGSRRQEVDRLLSRMLDAAVLISEKVPQARFTIGAAPMIPVEDHHIPPDIESKVEVSRDATGCLASADLVIATSGTVTLQSAISGTPTIVVYRTSRLTFAIGKKLVRIPDIAMPNVLAGERIVPELLQEDAHAGRIADEVLGLLGDGDAYSSMSSRLLGLRDILTKEGGLKGLAQKALDMCSGGD